VKRRRQADLMRLQKGIVRRRQRARTGDQVRLLVDGPAAEHELVLRGRLEGQAPDIDSLVYLTDCDPASVSAGDFIQVEIVGSRDYDLLARPLSVPAAV
jgi:ribosomal protein S12 methylthiotransferase